MSQKLQLNFNLKWVRQSIYKSIFVNLIYVGYVMLKCSITPLLGLYSTHYKFIDRYSRSINFK